MSNHSSTQFISKPLTSWDAMKFFLAAVLMVLSRGLLANVSGGFSNFLVLPFFLLPLLILFVKPQVKILKFNWATIFLIIFIIYVLLRSMIYDEPMRAFIGAPMYLYYPTIFFLFLLIVTYDDEYYAAVNKMFMYIFIYLTVFAVLQLITKNPLTTYEQKKMPMSLLVSIYPNFRLSSSIGSSLPFGVVYSMLCTYIYVLYIYTHKFKYLIILFISTIVLFGVWSRGAFGMFCIGVVVSTLYKWKEKRRIRFNIKKNILNIEPFRTIIATSIFSILIVILPYSIFNRMYQIFNWSSEKGNLKRVDRWVRIVDMVGDKVSTTMFGIGPGNTGNVTKYFDFNTAFGGGQVATESYYLKLLLELGLIGMILFILFIGYTLISAWGMKLLTGSRDEAIIKTAMIAMLMSHCIELLFLQSLEATAVGVMFWLVVAIITKIKLCEQSFHSKNAIGGEIACQAR